jgi:hypothetical protein
MCRFPASGSSRESFAHVSVARDNPFIDHPSDDTIRDSSGEKGAKVGVRYRIKIFFRCRDRSPNAVHERGQSHPSFRSCQFSYPLSFRAQVCEAQSSLPCCPSAVLSSRRPPSLGWVPVSPVPQRRQYYEGATTSHPRIPGHLFVSLPGSTRSLSASCSLLPALPGGWRLRSGQDHCSAGGPTCRLALAWT